MKRQRRGGMCPLEEYWPGYILAAADPEKYGHLAGNALPLPSTYLPPTNRRPLPEPSDITTYTPELRPAPETQSRNVRGSVGERSLIGTRPPGGAM